jgi:hypothetical protein
MITDKDAITQAQAFYREACKRVRKLPRDVIGEVAHAEGRKFVTLFDDDGKLTAIYRVAGDGVVDLDGAELARVRTKLTNRKVR